MANGLWVQKAPLEGIELTTATKSFRALAKLKTSQTVLGWARGFRTANAMVSHRGLLGEDPVAAP